MTLNEAIFEVITTKYKKDAEEAHEIVKNAGYEVFKRDGAYNISNPVMNKRIEVESDSYYWRMTLHFAVSYKTYGREAAAHVNFVGYLETARNDAYSEFIHRNVYGVYDTAIEKYKTIRSIKYSIMFEEKRIDKIKKQLESLQEELEDAYKAKAYSEMRLEKFKRECKLA